MSDTKDTPTKLSALYAGAAVGVVLGAAYLTFPTAPSSVVVAWSTASGYITAGLLFLTGGVLVVGLPVWVYARRAGAGSRRSVVLLGIAAILTAVVLGVVVGLITGQLGIVVGLFLLGTLWCSVAAGVLARPLSEARTVRMMTFGVLIALALAAAITLLAQSLPA